MNLQNEITKRGLRKNWIAKKAGITPSYLTLIVKNKRNLKRNPELKNLIHKIIQGLI